MLFRNKNAQKFSDKSLLAAGFLDHWNATVHLKNAFQLDLEMVWCDELPKQIISKRLCHLFLLWRSNERAQWK